ncbi:PLP-dependent aminotransferase family protein [Ferruginivarius sediminum]|uniref:PLP-dependent aminotransferase family protein n=1 Tax=Ferruginivarius sediminum TaxID=2661937 RepID=A0A369TD18_9PROT|nr:PLP-dependent aminotransferase family protein [Ferruginivarius sediminum]RDD63223.1 PLP-dependent aminotransferase family protein [Ferruginivarius sediminum]
MPRRADRSALVSLSLDAAGATPLHRQLYRQLREAMLAGRLAPGARLPSSRALARELGCARNTVLSAFDQLFAEGYLDGRSGSGTYVSRVLPEGLLPKEASPAESEDAGRRVLSHRGRTLAALFPVRGERPSAFEPGVPDTTLFPFELWRRLLTRPWRGDTGALTRHGDAGGYRPLRQAIADYLRGARGLDCDWRQVFVTSGAQQALDIVARLLLDPGEAAWVEEPGYGGLRGALTAAGARVVPVPLDDEGLDIAAGRKTASDARLAVVSPSHQYPMGTVMSLPRRLQLLDWARAADAWIVEDDYDSEYRYAGPPLAALQSLDRGGRVIYLGTFSKVLFPGLRIGYLVVPDDLVEPLARARRALDDHPGIVAQPALAAFIAEGHFAAHLRRMRRLYKARQDALVGAAEQELAGLLEVAPDAAGMHLVAALAPALAARMNDWQAAARALDAGVTAPALADYHFATPYRQGLLLGYAGVPESEIAPAVRRLARALAA